MPQFPRRMPMPRPLMPQRNDPGSGVPTCSNCGQRMSDEDIQKVMEHAVMVPPGGNLKGWPQGSAKQVGDYGYDEAQRESAVHATGKKKREKIRDLARQF